MSKRNTISIVENMTMKELATFAEVSLTITGADNVADMYNMINSKFNNIEGNRLNAVPLRQWCIEENLNYKVVFEILQKYGYINHNNMVQPKLIEKLYPSEEGMETKVAERDMILFNSLTKHGGKPLMIRPESLVKNEFISLFSDVGGYQGSKAMTTKQLKRANKHIAHLVDWDK